MPVEGELDDALDFKLGGEVGAEFGESVGTAVGDLGGPGIPGGGGVLAAQDVEEDEVFEPVAVFAAVLLEGVPLGGRVLREEAGGGLLQQRHLGGANVFEVDAGGICAGCGDVSVKLVGRKPAPFDENFERDEQRVAGEGGDGGVRRGAVADGIEREHLPESLFGGGEEIGEGEGGGTEVADAARGVERRDVEEKAGGAIESHSGTGRPGGRACGALLGRLPLVAAV